MMRFYRFIGIYRWVFKLYYENISYLSYKVYDTKLQFILIFITTTYFSIDELPGRP